MIFGAFSHSALHVKQELPCGEVSTIYQSTVTTSLFGEDISNIV